MSLNRRRFIAASSALTTAVTIPAVHTSVTVAQDKPKSPNSRLGVGAIGLRYQGTVITEKAREYGDIRGLCDVDRHVREQARASFGSTPLIFEDYHDLLARKDIDVVLIGTPDHWHAKMIIDACRAGKDVYCEKPLTLTVDEGKHIIKAAKETGRVVQVGSWQRSDSRFRTAVEMVRGGRIGKLQRVDVVLGKNVLGGPFTKSPVPRHFNWNLWQGQTPEVPYIEERSHYTFRWWYEYSGGQMTDWGAHHVDIAHWAVNSDPIRFESKAVFPDTPDGYNVAKDFETTVTFADGVVMTISDTGRNGILFTGESGRIFVNRGDLEGKPVEDLKANPLPRENYRLYDFDNLDRPPRAGKLDAIINHMGNFFDCVREKKKPLSDIESSHRTISTCHLSNISQRLGRTLEWNAKEERFVNDEQADKMLRREQRSGFEVG
ncbi:MAG: Gfo/Idh/MocA family oxidoreductase [Pirellulales bacterium]